MQEAPITKVWKNDKDAGKKILEFIKRAKPDPAVIKDYEKNIIKPLETLTPQLADFGTSWSRESGTVFDVNVYGRNYMQGFAMENLTVRHTALGTAKLFDKGKDVTAGKKLRELFKK